MLANLIRRPEQRVMTPSSPAQLGWAQYLHLFSDFSFNGVSYMVPSGSISQLTALQSVRNPIVLRCIILRAAIFSEVAFGFQNKRYASQPGKFFGTPALQILEEPWPTGSTKDLLGRMEVDNCMYGNSYWYKSTPNQLTWLDPTRMRILTAPVQGPSGVNAGVQLVAYELVDARQHAIETFLPGEIIHYRGVPDPDNPFRGLSWLSALLQDVTTDADISNFKSAFLRNSATPNLVITLPEEMSQDAIANFRDRVEASHVGPQQAFKTMYITEGSKVTSVGSSWSDMELFATQSYGDTRLCAAAGVPASLVGIAEGLKGSTLNAGNFTATRRAFADGTLRDLWSSVCAALKTVVPPPNSSSRLWYDDSSVDFLVADLADLADIMQKNATSVMTFVNSGFEPQSAADAVAHNDLGALVPIDGLTSVQLQPLPDPDAPKPAAIPPPGPTLKLVAPGAKPADNEDDDGK